MLTSTLSRLALLVLTPCLLAVPTVSQADTTPGFTLIWGGDGPNAKQQLRYLLEYGSPGHPSDRYYLRLGKQNLAVSGIVITYPDYYSGVFDPRRIEVRVGGKSQLLSSRRGQSIPLTEVKLDKEAQVLQLIPEQPIPAGTSIEVVLSNVQNPGDGGTYFFNCQVASPGNTPLLRYVGTWILNI